MSLTPRIDDIQPNLWLNGALDLWQRQGDSVFANGGGNFLTADRITCGNQGSTTKEFSIQRSTDVPTLAQSGFVAAYSYLTTCVTPTSTFAAADICAPFFYRMEGIDYQQLHGSQVTFSFWIKVSQVGMYSLNVNGAQFTRTYITVFNVAVANTWQFVSKTIQLETALGSYLFAENTVGLEFGIGGVSGSNTNFSTFDSWISGNSYSSSVSVNWMATTGATVQIALPSVTKGPIGLPAGIYHRSQRTFGQELAACQRYCQVITGVANQRYGVGPCITSTVARLQYQLPVKMVNAPGLSFTPGNTFLLAGPFGSIVVTAIVDNGTASTSFVTFAVSVASGLSAGQCVELTGNAGDTATIIMSAEF